MGALQLSDRLFVDQLSAIGYRLSAFGFQL
jgi:hypothetical protein